MSSTRAAPVACWPAPQAQSILVGIVRSLEVVEERLTALAPHTRLAEPHVQELREIRALVMALTVSRAQEE